MKAIVQDNYGDVESLYISSVARPAPGKGEVLVRVRAVSLNPADKFVMRGDPRFLRLFFGWSRPRQTIRGQDFAGTVEQLGDGVDAVAVGDEVFGEIPGTLAEYAVGPVKKMAPMPSSLSFEQAAAIPMAALAALHLLRKAKVGKGTSLLINGASGGIGTFAIQLAKHWGALVTAVCSTRNVEVVRSLGADTVIDYTAEDLLAVEERFDVILDNVGNHRIRDLRPLLTRNGTLMPNTGEPGPDGTALRRLAKTLWHNLTSRHHLPMVTSSPNTADLTELANLVADGTLTVVIDTLFDFDHAADAMARLATGHARGKVVVTINGED